MASVIVCPACDLAHRISLAAAAGRTRCSRCRALLQRPQLASIDTAIAVAFSALVLFIFSSAYPLVTIHSNGATRQASLIGAAWSLHTQGYTSLAALVFLTTVINPLAQILGLLYVLIPLRQKRRAPGHSVVFRTLSHARPWTFIEVFMLGILVALVRLSAYASIVPGVAVWACGLFMLALAALTSITSPEQFWRWAEKAA